jgi:hypothetical protein
MVHGSLLDLKILLYIIILTNFDVKLNDHYKAKTNASEKALPSKSHS